MTTISSIAHSRPELLARYFRQLQRIVRPHGTGRARTPYKSIVQQESLEILTAILELPQNLQAVRPNGWRLTAATYLLGLLRRYCAELKLNE